VPPESCGFFIYFNAAGKEQISNFVHCNTLKLQALKFYFCAFCTFLRLYQVLIFHNSLDTKYLIAIYHIDIPNLDKQELNIDD